MRPFHLKFKLITGLALFLGFTFSPNAERLQNPSGPGGVAPQAGPVPTRPPRLRATDAPVPGEPGGWNQKAAKRQADLSQLKTESDELQKLAAGLPDQLAKMRSGVLPADLVANLKKIEKLSKHIRGEIE
ncbi:MAG: hypothetical protein WCC76_18800 [Candidatus Acidiferrales bacterium]